MAACSSPTRFTALRDLRVDWLESRTDKRSANRIVFWEYFRPIVFRERRGLAENEWETKDFQNDGWMFCAQLLQLDNKRQAAFSLPEGSDTDEKVARELSEEFSHVLHQTVPGKWRWMRPRDVINPAY